jgi:hypothetical protein
LGKPIIGKVNYWESQLLGKLIIGKANYWESQLLENHMIVFAANNGFCG